MPEAPAGLRELAANVSEPAGAARYLKALHVNAKKAKFSAPLYWAYRTLGQHLDSPVLSSIWFQAVMNGQVRAMQWYVHLARSGQAKMALRSD